MSTKIMRYIFTGSDNLSRVTSRMSHNVKSSNKEIEGSFASLKTHLKSSGTGLGSLTGAVTGFGDAATVGSQKSSMFAKVLGGLNLATGVLEPAMAGVIVAAGGMAAGFAAAASGALVFSVVAQAVFAKASDAATKAQTANDAYKTSIVGINVKYKEQMSVATTRAQRISAQTSKETAMQSALAQKVKATSAAYLGLSPAQVKLAKSIQIAKNQWQQFIKLSTPGVANTMRKAFGVLPLVFKLMQPFLAPVEKALNSIISKVKVGLNSAYWNKFVDLLANGAGPALSHLAAIAGNVAHGIAGILTAFMPMQGQMLGGIEKITKKFAQWGENLSGGTGFKSLMTMFRTETPKAMAILKNLGTTLVNLGKSLTGLSGVGNSMFLLNMLLPISQVLATISKNQALSRLILYMWALHSVTGKLKPAFQGMGDAMGFLKDAWKGVAKFSLATEGATTAQIISAAATRAWGLAMDALPWVALAAAIVAVAILIIKYHKQIWAFALKVWRNILDIIKGVWNWVKHNWPLLLAIFTGPIGLAVLYIIKHFNSIQTGAKAVINFIKNAWSNGIDAIIGFFRTLINRILGFFGSIIHGASWAFGWIPGVGGKLKTAAKHFDAFRDRVNRALGGINNHSVTVGVGFATSRGRPGVPGFTNPGPPVPKARGGVIRGPGGPTADRAGIFALSNDEYVVRASSHRKYGTHFLDAINAGRMAAGGPASGINIHTRAPGYHSIMASIVKTITALAKSWGGNASSMLGYALQFVNRVPYVWGGTTTAGWDCSGFMGYVMRHFGFNPPRVSQDQQRWATPTTNRPGALVFFGNPAHHVGMSLGNGNMVSALGTQWGTIISSLAGNSGFGLPHMARGGAIRYDRGGALRPGYTLAYNGTGRDEYVSRPGGGVSVSIHPRAVIGTKDELARYVCDALTQYQNHGGKVPWKRSTS